MPTAIPSVPPPSQLRDVVIDTDAGVDDAVAILSLLRAKNCRVKAITTVEGNASLHNCTKNVATILAIDSDANGHIPVYPGCQGPFIQEEGYKPSRWPGHGAEGLGGCRHLYESEISPAIKGIAVHWDEHAAIALIRLTKANPGMILVALGPLSNLAMAIRLDPDFLSYVDEVRIMGGSLLGKGNSRRAAEFNFAFDAEAAHIVFTASTLASKDKPKLILSPWELCLENSFEWSLLDEIVAHSQTRLWARFLRRITEKMAVFCREKQEIAVQDHDLLHQIGGSTIANHDGSSGSSKSQRPPRHDFYVPEWISSSGSKNSQKGRSYFLLCDTKATFPLSIPDSVRRSYNCHAVIEREGTHTRGILCIEWNPLHAVDQRWCDNVTILTQLDQNLVEAEMRRIFLE